MEEIVMKKLIFFVLIGLLLSVFSCDGGSDDDSSGGGDDDSCPVTGISAMGVYDDFDTAARDVVAVGNYAYVAVLNSSPNPGGLVVIDVSSKNSPVRVSSYLPTSAAYALYSYNISVSGNYAYVDCGSVRDFAKIDISDPSSVSLVSQVNGSGVSADLYADGDNLYMTDNDNNKVYMLDDSEFSQLASYTATTHQEYYAVNSISGNSKNIFCVNHYHVLILDKQNLTLKKDIAFSSSPYYFADDNYLYVAVDGALQIYSLEDPSNPVKEGSIAIADAAKLVVTKNCAVLVSAENIALFDVSDKANPKKISDNSVSIGVNGISVDDLYLYVADGGGGNGKLRIYQLLTN